MPEPLLLRRTISANGATIELEVVLPAPAARDDVVLALREIEAAAAALENCPSCRAPHGLLHEPECVCAPDGLIEQARGVAIRKGMTP